MKWTRGTLFRQEYQIHLQSRPRLTTLTGLFRDATPSVKFLTQNNTILVNYNLNGRIVLQIHILCNNNWFHLTKCRLEISSK